MSLNCYDSGLTSDTYNAFSSRITTADPEVVKAIRKVNISPQIQSYAIDYYYQISKDEKYVQGQVKAIKSKRKERKVFNCIFLSFNKVGCPSDPKYVAEITGLPKEEIETAFNELLSSVQIDPVLLSKHYLIRIGESHGFETDINVLLERIQEIYNTCSKLNSNYIKNSPAKNISIGMIMFFLTKMNNFQLYKEKLEKSFYLSWPQIKKHMEAISTIYNSA